MVNGGTQRFPASATLPADRDILVCIFQRGAADGLNTVVPYGDSDYYARRSTIAVPAPGMAGGAIDLDGFFGLHPALGPLKPIYDAGDLALVHATGMPHGSRSHFTAQGLVERGVTDKAGPTSGWLGRHLSLLASASNSAFRVVAISGNVPVSLTGANEPLAISNLNDFGFDQDIIDSGYPTVLANLFRSPVPFSATAEAALSAMDELQAANLSAITPDNGAVYPDTALGKKLLQVGQLIKSTLPVEVICLDADGWDHHENLPTYIQGSLAELADAVSAFHTDMGAQMQRIVVLVHTEFGRRVAENASAGTDHGTGSLAYLFGGGVNGGQVVSSWPGLATANLEMGEDLKITTDLRTVLSELLGKRLGGSDAGIVFPGFSGPLSANLFLG
ncbi:MAG: DUF1501 domain-containing protein [Thiogranum sp.]|jgi:uncharacterized protein (DUF1501 family)|nr:DUF1501 domain-containing protein [Thiogranum sp.]